MKDKTIRPILCHGCIHTEKREYNFHQMQCCTLTGKPEYRSECLDYRKKSVADGA